LEKTGRFIARRAILRHHFQMHIAGLLLVGIGIAAVVAILGASKQSHSLKDDIVISHSSRDDDALL
jgi:hypothetical protein